MRTRHVMIASAALALWTVSAHAQTPAAPTAVAAPAATTPAAGTPALEGVFRIGGLGNDNSGNLNKVGEYLPLESVAKVGTEFWGQRNGFRYDVTAYYGGTSRDQNYRAEFDIKRLVKAHVGYQKFGHRLDHDPLTTYMDASSGLGGTFVTTSTNTDPTAQYSMGVGEFTSGIELTTPTKIPVKFFVNHNRMTRDGAHQVMTIAHCSSCHVYCVHAQAGRVDEGDNPRRHAAGQSRPHRVQLRGQ